NLHEVRLEQLPRMADFAIWVTACEEALAMARGEFASAYEDNRVEGRNLALEASPIFEPLKKLAEPGFRGTPTELLTRLNELADDNLRRDGRWPKAPNSLGGMLRRMAGNLRAAGVHYEFARGYHDGRRVITIKSTAETLKTPSAPSASSATQITASRL